MEIRGLFIDTSSQIAILGLSDGSKILKFEIIEGGKKLSESLFPALEKFCDIQEISYIAVGVGPGSYMGVRTAATIAKTLAFARSLPLIEFSSPLAFLPKEMEGTFAFIGDAKMEQFYLISGRAENGVIHDLSSPNLINKDQINTYLQDKDFIIGEGHLSPSPNLEWVVPLVYEQYLQNNTLSPNALELIYLR